MDKHIEISILYDFYKQLLTSKQADLIDLYYNQDLSLSEIADMQGITRQGVRDHLMRGEKQLLAFESALGLCRRFLAIQETVKQMQACVLAMQTEHAQQSTQLKAMEQYLNQLMGDVADGF